MLIGCLWYSASLFSPGIWRSGNAIAVLGGTGLIVGGAMYGATCAQLDISWGAHLLVGTLLTSVCFLSSIPARWVGVCLTDRVVGPSSSSLVLAGAGVLVTVGWGRISANLNLVRINGGQFSAV